MTQFNGETDGKAVVEAYKSNVHGKIFLITGPSIGGIGAETALSLASAQPKKIILAGRSQTKVQPVINQIKSINSKIEVTFVELDLSDHGSVRRAAQEIKESIASLDVLINCAGVMAIKTYTTSADGFEMHLASNHLGHFLLTNLLLSKLVAPKGVVINVSSTAYTLAEVDFEDPSFQGGKTYNPWRAYARSKTANILFSVGLGDKLKTKDVAAFSVDPGLILETKLQSNTGVTEEMFMEGYKIAMERYPGEEMHQTPRTLQQGCATILLASLDSALREQSPMHLKECAMQTTKDYAHSTDNADRLWKMSEKMVGEKFEV